MTTKMQQQTVNMAKPFAIVHRLLGLIRQLNLIKNDAFQNKPMFEHTKFVKFNM